MKAYSYVRFSHPSQFAGDSFRRQSERASEYCRKHGLTLDASLTLRDLGVSAFRGKNAAVGKLRTFLDAVNKGKVASGSTLIVESFDRISRQGIDEGYDLIKSILKAGVRIVTLSPEREFDQAATKSLSKGALEIQLILERAAEESTVKSDRDLEQWTERRKKASREKPMTSLGRAWLTMQNGRWELIPDRAKVIKRIFRMSIDGNGHHVITKILNDEKVPPMTLEWKKKKGTDWQPSYVIRILRSRAVIGEYQPHIMKDGKRVPDGKAIPDYYPRVVDDQTFYRAASAMNARKTLAGPRGNHVRNLFTGLMRDARDGTSMVTVSPSDKSAPIRLVSSGSQKGLPGSKSRTIRYDVFEQAFLMFVSELTPADVLPKKGPDLQDQVEALTAKLESIDGKIRKLSSDLRKHGDFAAGISLLRELEQERESVAADLDRSKTKIESGEVDSLKESKHLIELLRKTKDEKLTALRTKLRQRIREVISEIWVLSWDVENWTKKAAEVQVHLGNGKIKGFVIGNITSGQVFGVGGQLVPSGITPSAPLLRDYHNDAAAREFFKRRMEKFGEQIKQYFADGRALRRLQRKLETGPSPSEMKRMQRDLEKEVLDKAKRKS